jgi:hypothetical protein
MVLAGGGASLAVASAPAGASNTQMTAVGSFTTFFMMHALFPEVNMINPNAEVGSETQAIAGDSLTCQGGLTFSTGTQPPNGSGQGKTFLAGEEGKAATQQGCVDFSRSSSAPGPNVETLPSTSTEGGDPASSNLDYYAYALDGVAPLVGNDAPSTVRVAGSDVGPGNGLTLAQIRAIYECVDTNWDQITVNGVTGANSPIVTFWPQSGSGTRAVYTDVLGFDPAKFPSVLPDTCGTTFEPISSFGSDPHGAAGSIPNEENTEDGLIYQNSIGVASTALKDPGNTGVPAGSVTAAAIYIYSAGKFASEWNDTTDNTSTAQNVVDFDINGANTMGNFDAGPTTNDTGTLTMATVQSTGGSGVAYDDLTLQAGRFNADTNRGTYAIDGNTVAEANEWYSNDPTAANPTGSTSTIPGVRYVYNVADTVLPGYNGAKDLIGFDNQTLGTKSTLCNGDDAGTITSQGFLPLTTGSGAPSGSDAAGATCREFAGLVFPAQGTPIHWVTPTFDNRDH